jgi:hypothetical protein
LYFVVEIGGLTNDHVICIYTYGSEEDKKRVRDALYELGFIRRIPYKSDAATAAGVYTNRDSSHNSQLAPLSTMEAGSSEMGMFQAISWLQAQMNSLLICN